MPTIDRDEEHTGMLVDEVIAKLGRLRLHYLDRNMRRKARHVRFEYAPVSPSRLTDIQVLIVKDVDCYSGFACSETGGQHQEVTPMVDADLEYISGETHCHLLPQESGRDSGCSIV